MSLHGAVVPRGGAKGVLSFNLHIFFFKKNGRGTEQMEE